MPAGRSNSRSWHPISGSASVGKSPCAGLWPPLPIRAWDEHGFLAFFNAFNGGVLPVNSRGWVPQGVAFSF